MRQTAAWAVPISIAWQRRAQLACYQSHAAPQDNQTVYCAAYSHLQTLAHIVGRVTHATQHCTGASRAWKWSYSAPTPPHCTGHHLGCIAVRHSRLGCPHPTTWHGNCARCWVRACGHCGLICSTQQDCLSNHVCNYKTMRAQTWRSCMSSAKTHHPPVRSHHRRSNHPPSYNTDGALEWLDSLVMQLDQIEGVRETCLMVVVLGSQGPVPWGPAQEPAVLTPQRWRVAADGQAHKMVCCACCLLFMMVQTGCGGRRGNCSAKAERVDAARAGGGDCIHLMGADGATAAGGCPVRRLPLRCTQCVMALTQAGWCAAGHCAGCPAAGGKWLRACRVPVGRAGVQAGACRQIWRMT